MELRRLLAGVHGATVRGEGSPWVTGITSDSRAVRPGFVFVALPGATASSVHGSTYVPRAVAAGAVAVVVDAPLAETPSCLVVNVADARTALATLAETFHGRPSSRMRLMGVTGTNGKTTTAHVLESIAIGNGERAGFIGTTAVRMAGEERAATHTTPPAEVLSATLAEMAQVGVTTCGIEVSSHAVEQRRVEGLDFAAAIFTNLTQDHLDYHGTMDAYFAAKARLFTSLLGGGAAAVLNAEDERVRSLVPRSRGRVFTFHARGGEADVVARRVEEVPGGTVIHVDSPWGALDLQTSLVGTYNVANVLGAVTAHLASGTPRDAVARGVQMLTRVPGRLDPVKHPRGATVLVDYAHTDDALARALDAVRPRVAAGGRLIVVFGCGGDRDAGKRPRMGEAAARRADLVIVTNDNPRSEDPALIADAILGGVRAAGMTVQSAENTERGAVVELDRRRAIDRAVRSARQGDVVLIAGKGHEREQIIGNTRLPFDDRTVAEECGKAVTP